MKTAKQWIEEISESGEGHECACICARCKNGKETFLLESDIIKIQADAFANAAKIAEMLGDNSGQDDPRTDDLSDEQMWKATGCYDVSAKLNIESDFMLRHIGDVAEPSNDQAQRPPR